MRSGETLQIIYSAQGRGYEVYPRSGLIANDRLRFSAPNFIKFSDVSSISRSCLGVPKNAVAVRRLIACREHKKRAVHFGRTSFSVQDRSET